LSCQTSPAKGSRVGKIGAVAGGPWPLFEWRRHNCRSLRGGPRSIDGAAAVRGVALTRRRTMKGAVDQRSAQTTRAPRRLSGSPLSIVVLGLVIVLCPLASRPADAHNSLGSAWSEQQNRARAAVKQGRHIPLFTVVRKLRRRMGGKILDAGLEHWNGRTVYRVRWAAKGRRADYLVDAQTGHVLGAAPR
jgi:hypothetical protein